MCYRVVFYPEDGNAVCTGLSTYRLFFSVTSDFGVNCDNSICSEGQAIRLKLFSGYLAGISLKPVVFAIVPTTNTVFGHPVK
jgi:hypothetical protein